jgi:hypothetical protein
MIKTGTSTIEVPLSGPKPRHSSIAGGIKYNSCISDCEISQGSRSRSFRSLSRNAEATGTTRKSRARVCSRAGVCAVLEAARMKSANRGRITRRHGGKQQRAAAQHKL